MAIPSWERLYYQWIHFQILALRESGYRHLRTGLRVGRGLLFSLLRGTPGLLGLSIGMLIRNCPATFPKCLDCYAFAPAVRGAPVQSVHLLGHTWYLLSAFPTGVCTGSPSWFFQWCFLMNRYFLVMSTKPSLSCLFFLCGSCF